MGKWSAKGCGSGAGWADGRGDMVAVWLVVAAALRGRWRSWLVLAVVVGLAGGLVIAVAAGARRTDAAYPALVTWSQPPDEWVFLDPDQGKQFANVPVSAVMALPQVTSAQALTVYHVLEPGALGILAPTGQGRGTFWRRKLLAGRLPAPGRPDEADASFTAAQALGLRVGSVVDVRLAGPAGSGTVDFRITGIDAAPGEFPPQFGAGSDFLWTTPAFARRQAGRLLGTPSVALLLRHGAADVPGVQRAIGRLGGGKVVSDYQLGAQADNTKRSIRLQAITLWMLAGLLTMLGLLVIGQLLSRLTALESASFGALRACGMSRGSYWRWGWPRRR